MSSEERRRDLFARCRAFIFPGEEDFGITPLEAMAAGPAGDRLRGRRRAGHVSSRA